MFVINISMPMMMRITPPIIFTLLNLLPTLFPSSTPNVQIMKVTRPTIREERSAL